MSMINAQRPNAAARLAALPLVDAVRTKLSAVYVGAKRVHPGLWYVCEALESGVAAVLSPVMGKLEPHISVANDAACKSLDWLETTFPVLYTPTEQLVTAAKNKMSDVRDAMSIAARGSADCVGVGVAWLTVRLEGVHQERAGAPLVDTCIAAATVGLDRALAASEALVERLFPPKEEEEGAEPLQGAEATERSGFPDRLFAIAAKLYRRSFSVTRGSTLMSTVQKLQQHLVSAIFFLSQKRDSPTKRQRSGEPSRPRAPEIFYMDSVQKPLTAPPACRLRKPNKSPTLGNESPDRGCVGH